MPFDEDPLTVAELLAANLFAYGGLLIVGLFMIVVPIWVPLGAMFGAMDFAVFGGLMAALGWLACVWRQRITK